MSTRNIPQIDGPDAELQFVIVPFEKVRRRAAELVARTDPVLLRMYDLVDALTGRRKYHNAASALIAFYGADAASAARRMRLIAHTPSDLSLIQGLIEEIQHS